MSAFNTYNTFSFGAKKDPTRPSKHRKPRDFPKLGEQHYAVVDPDYQQGRAAAKALAAIHLPEDKESMTAEEKFHYNRKRFTEITGFVLKDPCAYISDDELALYESMNLTREEFELYI